MSLRTSRPVDLVTTCTCSNLKSRLVIKRCVNGDDSQWRKGTACEPFTTRKMMAVLSGLQEGSKGDDRRPRGVKGDRGRTT